MKKTAVVNEKRCVACGACTMQCPRNAVTIYKGCFASIDREKCVGCGKCSMICPANCIEISQREAQNED